MAAKKKNQRKLRNKYRFSIQNSTSHNEIFAFRTSGLGVILGTVFVVLVIIASVIFLIAFTPLKETIPGYPDTQTRRIMAANAIKADSLERAITQWEWQLTNIQRILSNQAPLELENIFAATQDSTAGTVATQPGRSRQDSLFRQEVLKQEQFVATSPQQNLQIDGILFFTPVKGVVSDGFDPSKKHFAVDIAVAENASVFSVLDGTVILADYNSETGYVIQLQHNNNLISIYKHNTKLLKSVGERVKAGTAIALAGNTGTTTTGTHLHFELWHNGSPVDPAKYINF